MISHTGLIQDWIERWAAIDATELKEKRNRGKKPKMKRLGETTLATRIARESAPALHETSTPDCPCGIPSRCKVHLVEEKPTPSLQEELAKLGPVERAWVINHELTPAQLEELGVKRSETPRVPRKCTCGTEIPCMAHD